MDISFREITSKKVRGKNADFSTIKITLKKYVEATWIFLPAKLHGKKLHENNVDFLTSDITPKTYMETTWII